MATLAPRCAWRGGPAAAEQSIHDLPTTRSVLSAWPPPRGGRAPKTPPLGRTCGASPSPIGHVSHRRRPLAVFRRRHGGDTARTLDARLQTRFYRLVLLLGRGLDAPRLRRGPRRARGAILTPCGVFGRTVGRRHANQRGFSVGPKQTVV